MAKITISAAQLKVLADMQDGAMIMYMKGIQPAAFLSYPGHSKPSKTVSIATVWALKEKGLVTPIKDDWRDWDFVISEAGRQAIKENDNEF